MIEVIATNIADCMLLNQCPHIGRIEFCSQMGKGGFTPDFELVKLCLEFLNIPMRVMIRNQESYDINPYELNLMCEQISQFSSLKIDAFVIGCNQNGNIDETALQKITQTAFPIKIIYHRAFDYLDDPISSLELLKKYGVSGVLSSGRRGNVDESSVKVSKKYTQFGLEIVIGGGITRNNFLQFSQISNIHLGSDLRIQNDFNQALDPDKIQALVI